MIQFEKSFFEAEERENFLVPEMMKRAWAVQMDILRIVDVICKEHNIPYFADSGTLLGAVRHQGFIPWDDDIDIAMKREDYIRFIEAAEKELPMLEPGCCMHIIGKTEGFHLPHCKLLNSEEINFEDEFLQRWYGCPYSTGIDIFPLDCVPDNKEEAATLVTIIKGLLALAWAWDATDCPERPQEQALAQMEEILHCKIDRTGDVTQQILMLVDELSQTYRGEGTELACYQWWARQDSYHFPKSCYERVEYLPFENLMLPVPVDYDTVLRAEFGDYMVPVRNAAAHEYPFYKKQQNFWEEYLKTHAGEEKKVRYEE